MQKSDKSRIPLDEFHVRFLSLSWDFILFQNLIFKIWIILGIYKNINFFQVRLASCEFSPFFQFVGLDGNIQNLLIFGAGCILIILLTVYSITVCWQKLCSRYVLDNNFKIALNHPHRFGLENLLFKINSDKKVFLLVLTGWCLSLLSTGWPFLFVSK